MLIHFIGRREIRHGSDSTIRFSACRKIDERTGPLTATTGEVTCENCRKHGLFKHAAALEAGQTPATGKRYSLEYDDLIVLSREERDRLDHYRPWFAAKAMSMVRLTLDGSDVIVVSVYWLERDLGEWLAVTQLVEEGRIREAVSRVKALNARMPCAPREDDESLCKTAHKLVNIYRRNGYRIPEYGSGRLIPHGSDWSWIQVDYSPASLDEAIEALSRDQAARLAIEEVDVQVLDPSVAFELSAIIADTIIEKSSVNVTRGALVEAETGLPKALIELLADRFGWTGAVVFYAGASRGNSVAEIADALREGLAHFEWMDPSVIRAAAEAAVFANEQRRALHTEASALQRAGKDPGDLRKLASLYRRPRGIPIRNGDEHHHVRYRDWHRTGMCEAVRQGQGPTMALPAPRVAEKTSPES
jgi:hypothetical protein